MREDQHRFLMLLGQLPARLTAEQAAWLLNCQPHDVPVLVAGRLLKPLGNPQANSIKFFATADILEQVKDRNWLVRCPLPFASIGISKMRERKFIPWKRQGMVKACCQ